MNITNTWKWSFGVSCVSCVSHAQWFYWWFAYIFDENDSLIFIRFMTRSDCYHHLCSLRGKGEVLSSSFWMNALYNNLSFIYIVTLFRNETRNRIQIRIIKRKKTSSSLIDLLFFFSFDCVSNEWTILSVWLACQIPDGCLDSCKKKRNVFNFVKLEVLWSL